MIAVKTSLKLTEKMLPMCNIEKCYGAKHSLWSLQTRMIVEREGEGQSLNI